jgi:hypothetical protein
MSFKTTTTRQWFESGDNVQLVANVLVELSVFTTPQDVLYYFEKCWHYGDLAELVLAADDPFDPAYYEALDQIWFAANEEGFTYNGNLVEPDYCEEVKEIGS